MTLSFISQPYSEFGDLICEELNSEEAGQLRWRTFEFAAAWLNLSGAKRIKESAKKFLAAGGRIRATVGLDFGSTSYEGLGSLLDLEDGAADITTHVFFDENPACTFHPKVFLFTNGERALAFVGSHNVTGAGLQTNVEAALVFLGSLEDDTVRAARQALEEWRDVGREPRRTRRLTREFLEQLRERGYVRTEEEIRARRNTESAARTSQSEPLFGRSTTRAGGPGRGTSGRRSGGVQTMGSGTGEVLLMRVRPRRNGKQLQISMRILEASFMKGVGEVFSTDGSRRQIGYSETKGKRNTARFEAPEMQGMGNPVARFHWIDVADPGSEADRILQYEVFDADSGGQGAEILRKLKEGISTPPLTDLDQLSREETVLSKPNRQIAQWYRLD